MPLARFKGVLICSSEDQNFPASNLINESSKKWKCEETGLESVYVVLQLENPTKINGIDIGNEHSAFVEVAVGRTGWPIDKFKTILVTSSFMTINESRVSENPNRVRCFQKDALMPDVLDEKWELIKVTCTQGFNKHVKFGLSFVRVYTPDATTTSTPSLSSTSVSSKTIASPKEKISCDETLGLPKNNVFAKFRMRIDSSDSDKEESSSSLFSKWKQKKDSPEKSTNNLNISSAAAIREASASTAQLEKCTKINHKIETPKSRNSIKYNSKDKKKERLDRYRPAILYDDDDENTSNPKLEKIINQDKERIEQERKEQLDKKKSKKDITRDEKSKHKMESSANNFNTFLSMDTDDKVPEQPTTSSAKVQSDDDDIVEVKGKSPAKVDLSDSPGASQSMPKMPDETDSDDSDLPPVWKLKNKRPSTAHEQSASKRLRISTSSESSNTPEDVDISRILSGVVFVISGIQNPDRADMRANGIKMGAKYKPDWDNSCTHLVCAFKNTPKYKQVSGNGIIVNRDWINDCFDQKKKLPWQDYQL